jgi:leucyl-tRNA synthetase
MSNQSTSKFNHREIEEKWRKFWEEKGIFESKDTGKDKKYILNAFAYPSGSGLHAGHAEGYSASDIKARYWRMNGKDVLYPTGWDSFGLPAENYAIKTGVHPRINTDETIKYFQKQVRDIGISTDWTREIASHNPDYYKFTQWFFQLLYKRGLAYKKEALVNWDPVDQTVLANEQVLPDGTAERSGAKVEQKMMSQWFFKITDYAERLLNDLEGLDWPESTKQQQRNWIGKSEGAEVDFYGFYSSQYAYSYVMGVTDDFEQKFLDIGGEIIRKTEVGSFEVRFSREIKIKYEKIIWETLKPNYWNEYICDGRIYFQCKELNQENEEIGIKYVSGLHDEKILNLCNKYAKSDFKNIYKMVYDNDWYKNIIFKITVFTTRIDTIFSGTYLILAPEHPLTNNLTMAEQKAEVEAYQQVTKSKSQLQRTDLNDSKTGAFTGSYAINPANGFKMPIWISDFVLGNYGTGAVFADAHDERDFELAKKFNIPLQTSIKPEVAKVEELEQIKNLEKCYSGYGILYNSGQFDGMTSTEAKPAITKWGQEQGWAKPKITYRLRDWLVSRQRYWGSPIPVIYRSISEDIQKGIELVPEADLPVTLPNDVEFTPTGRSPLIDHKNFHESAEKLYGQGVRREVDTMDTFVCSSWYFFRFCSPKNTDVFATNEDLKKWCPVDEYIIGAEHTVLHLLYARFFTKVLQDAGYIDFAEPFLKMRHPGLIQGEDGRKMGKRYGNGVNPVDVIEEFGADTLRMYEMFMGPFDQPKPWNTNTVKGVRRFIERVWKMQDLVTEEPDYEKQTKVEYALHKLVKKVGEDIVNYSFNTAVAEYMKFVNLVEEAGSIHKVQYQWFLQVLAPFAPFATEEIYQGLNLEDKKSSIHLTDWPQYFEEMLIENTVTYAVQINGKVRTSFPIETEATDEQILEKAKTEASKWLENKEIKFSKIIKNKLVTFVI